MFNKNQFRKWIKKKADRITSKFVLPSLVVDLINDLIPELLFNLLEQFDIIPNKQLYCALVFLCILVKLNKLLNSQNENEQTEQ